MTNLVNPETYGSARNLHLEYKEIQRMKLLVIGAAGKTGTAIVEQALARGHHVTALVHHRDKYNPPAGVEVFAGDAQNPSKIEQAIHGQEAVLDALGGHLPWMNSTIETNGAKAVVEAMRRAGVRRLLIVSTIGEGESAANVHGWYGHLFMSTVLRGVMKDKAGMEAVIESADDLDWTIVRPAGLHDTGSQGDIRIVTPESAEKVRFIARADLARFMLDQINSKEYLHQAVGIANP